GIGASSVTFATYTLSLLDLSGANPAPLAIGAIVLLTGINYLGVKFGSAVQNVFTLLKLVALAALIVVGLVSAVHNPTGLPTIPLARGGSSTGAFGAALIPVLCAYGGWQSTNFVAGEL